MKNGIGMKNIGLGKNKQGRRSENSNPPYRKKEEEQGPGERLAVKRDCT
jgi:hypothetical protein